jgi:S1-C subfamily serine protease
MAIMIRSREMHNGQRHHRHQMPWNTCLALGMILLVMLTLPVPRLQAQEPDDAHAALRSLSKAFTQVAHDAMPAVVFIQVEKLLDADQVGLRRGTLIREVNRQTVHNTAEFMEALRESEQSKRVLLLAQDRRGTRFIALSLS